METNPEILQKSIDWVLYTEAGRSCALAALLFYVLAWWRILVRAGFPGGLAVLMLAPPFALAVWAFVAFAPWPARRELAALRKVQRVVHQAERRRLVG